MRSLSSAKIVVGSGTTIVGPPENRLVALAAERSKVVGAGPPPQPATVSADEAEPSATNNRRERIGMQGSAIGVMMPGQYL
jgi:hypothetical protein